MTLKSQTRHRAFSLSSRLPQGLDAELLRETSLSSVVLDLTESNPTRAQVPHGIALNLSSDEISFYKPLPLGPSPSREAVAQWLTQNGRFTALGSVMLVSSTSEALSFIFKMACDPNTLIACATPGYPLVPHIAELEGLKVTSFAIIQQQDGTWQIDLHSVQKALAAGVKVLVVVSPGNPTGVCLDSAATWELAKLCNRYHALAVFDEVFAPYHNTAPHVRLADVAPFDRAIALGGLSKAALLPQAKVAWLAVYGTKPFQNTAMAGLEWIGDAYLSVGVTGLVLPSIIAAMPRAQKALRARIARNFKQLAQILQQHGCATLDPYTAGWYAVVRPHAEGPLTQRARQRPSAHVADLLAEEAQVLLQPGFLFDLPMPHALVASLIVPEALHEQGWARVAHALTTGAAP